MPLVMVFAFLCLFLYHPDDALPALSLPPSAFIGTWVGPEGGTLVLRADGTFVADDACNLGEFGASGSGEGSWSVVSSDWKPGGTGVMLNTKESLGIRSDATGSVEAPVLWNYVGDPDSGEQCKMHKVSRG